MEHGAFPKLTPTPIRRRSIEAWFEFHRDTPLRYVYGPTGSGKTTAALVRARLTQHAVAFLTIPATGTAAAFLSAFNRTLGSSLTHTNDLSAAFPREERFELIVGDIDYADEEVRALLTTLPAHVPPNVTLTYLGRARRVVDMVSLSTKGLGAEMERNRLAFSQAEAAETCDALGVSYTPSDINQLIYGSEGWAFAVTSSIRDAASDGRGLHGALTRWQDRNRRLIEELLKRSLVGLLPGEVEAAQRIYAGETAGDAPAYGRLHDLGLLLSFSDSELRPLRAVAPAALKGDSRSEVATKLFDVPAAKIEMFGQFEMTIDGRKVQWFRRRDRQIIQFLALQLNTAATRRDLIATFWPNADPHLASQSLRTSCSTIRRALAQCIGYDRVHCYFTVGRELRLNTDYVSIASQRLRGHMREAEDALSHGEEAAARAHYLAATRIYRGRLLDSEGTEPWFRNELEMYAEMAAIAAERALEIRSRQRAHVSAAPDASATRLSFSPI